MNAPCTILLSDSAWRLATSTGSSARIETIPAGDDPSPEARVQAVKEALARLEVTPASVMLAVPASWCLCALIDTSDLERTGRRRAMAFRLEEHLPVSAEDVAADFIELDGDRALGVCVALSRLRAIVDAFEAAELAVRHICPAACLAASFATERDADANAVLVAAPAGDDEAPSFDLFELQRGSPVNWWWFAQDAQAVGDRLDELRGAADQPLRVALVEAGERARQLCEARAGVDASEVDDAAPDEAAAHHAAAVLEDQAEPWIELRRDALAPPGQLQPYRKPVGALVIAALVLIASVIGVTQWRGWQYQAAAERYRDQQATLYRETLDAAPPRGPMIRSRMASELRRLTGLSGNAGDGDASDQAPRPSALWHLNEVLSRLDVDVRYRLTLLRIGAGRIRVEGEAPSFAKAETLTNALRESPAYEVSQPQTRALDDRGVGFSFTATPIEDDSSTGGAAS